jgi:hypothetical protein
MTREDRLRNELIEELEAPVSLRRRVASALIRIGERIDPNAVASDEAA